MSHTTTSITPTGIPKAASHGLALLARPLWLTFVAGPRVLFTHRISGKCAVTMSMMCIPSLLFFAIMTVPAFVFQSPDQNAYFHFAAMLDRDSTRWLVYLLVAFCSVFSLAVPASIPNAIDRTEA